MTIPIKLFESPSEHSPRGDKLDLSALLDREPVARDWHKVAEHLSAKRVLITGAGGSIGSELAAQVATFGPASLILVDNCEYNLYRIDYQLKNGHSDLAERFVPRLGSIVDRPFLERVVERFRPQVIFHAAAYKHVPLLETNACVATLNNILGTLNLLETSNTSDLESFVLISSDKAVNPSNVMGATKRCCELLVQKYHSQANAKYAAVRFGNVLGSSGSVIPLFLEQIAAGGPVTVTHRDITRYFMLTSEAVCLVLQAAAMAQGGETFVLNMGEPVRIYGLAERLIRMRGLEPHRDIVISVVGLRPGERLYEELFIQGNECPTCHDDIMIAEAGQIDGALLDEAIREILLAAVSDNEPQCISLLKALAQCSAPGEPRREPVDLPQPA